MPRGDRTGPAGLGSMTGRAAGFCAGYSVPGYLNSCGSRTASFSGALGRMGKGRHRNFFYSTGLPGWARYSMGMPAWGGMSYIPYVDYPSSEQQIDFEQEKEVLKSQSEFLNGQLNDIQARLNEIEKQKETKKVNEKQP